MLRRAFSLCAVLGMVSAAQAGVIVTLVPTPAPVGGVYAPGQVVHVDILAQLDTAIPSPVPGNPGARLRSAQFDLSDSDPALGIATVRTHEGAEVNPVDGTINFWNFSTTSGCSGDAAACGDSHFIDSDISTNDILNITYTGLTSSASRQIALLASAPKIVGQLEITLPNTAGGADGYLLDVLNGNETDVNQGGEFRHGFGSATDPSVIYRANLGTVTGGQFRFVVPEPATIAMLGLGGLAAAFRRRRSA